MSAPRTDHHGVYASSQRRWTIASAIAAGFAATVAMLLPAGPAGASTAVIGLGTSDGFAVLAGSGITNTGATTISGDVGSSPTPSETGFGTVSLTGADHAGDAVTQQAKIDLTTGYNQAAGSGPPTSVATELGGTTLTPGVYNGATLAITGTLTLDLQGDPNAVFVFQTASTLITASSSSVTILGGGMACNVYWQVSSSATLGSNSSLIGTVLASSSITAATGATIQGRLLAQSGAVTLDHNTITRPACTTSPVTTTTPATTTTTPVATSSTSTAPRVTPTTTTPTKPTITSGRRGSSPLTPRGSTTTGTATTTGVTKSSIPPGLAFTGANLTLALVATAAIALGATVLVCQRRSRSMP